MRDLSNFSRQIWDMKYRLRAPDGTPLEDDIPDSWDRVAAALAAAEDDPAAWAPRFRAVLEDFAFLPAGRILAGAGTDRAVTLFNCFVMGRIEDSMGDIFAHLREAALTLQQGGGIGYDFSTVRPRGAPVHGVGADASGPLSFMDVWDAMCRTIMSAGTRRGAMMATLRCDHPDIEAFITAKQQPGRLRMFNLSVLVTDAFLAAVDAGADWPLVFAGQTVRTVEARALWDLLMRATYAAAEPGVIFIDRINALNNLQYCEEISATNPCGEQPLPPYGACLLGSVNLAALVRDPFTERAALDTDRLEATVATAVRMMDAVIDLSRFPLPEQAAEARAKRRIGLGVTGLADAFLMVGVRYGARPAVDLTADWLRRLRDAAYRASIDLAREKGPFALFDRDAYLDRPMIRALPEELRAGIRAHGIRNALLTSIAPTGTISLVADNVSSGIEPLFAFSYDRAVLLADGSRRVEEVGDHAVRLYRRLHGEDAPLPDWFVTAQTLTPADHLAIQAAAQPFVDSSISKTINCPADLPFEAFKEVYRQAHALGCKGCTTYRPNPVTGAVLSVGGEAGATDAPAPSAGSGTGGSVGIGDTAHPPPDRPETLEGRTYKLRWPESDHAIYVTVNDVLEPGADGRPRRRPFEVFINSKNMEHYAWTVALTRMISAVFRRGGEVAFVVEELKAVFDPRGGHWLGGRYVPSLLAAIGDLIERHMVETGFLPAPLNRIGPLAPADPPAAPPMAHPAAAAGAVRGGLPDGRPRTGPFCPRCGHPGLVRQEGCDLCPNCGYSRCG